jgi:hypothetical protein
MQYPGTMASRFDGNGASSIALDPIAEARELLHSAARLPYSVARSRQWSRRFRQRVKAAREALTRHITRSAEEELAASPVEHEPSRRPTAVEWRRNEHELLAMEIDALCAEAAIEVEVDIWRMIDLGERAILLERALKRHHDRLAGVMHELTSREFVGRPRKVPASSAMRAVADRDTHSPAPPLETARLTGSSLSVKECSPASAPS